MFCASDSLGINRRLNLEIAFAAFTGRNCRLNGTDKGRCHRNGYDSQHDDFEMLLHEGNATKEEAHQHKQRNPRNATHAIEQRELAEVHMPRASNKRSKGAEEWHKARDDDSEPTVLFEKVIELRHTLGRKSLDLARVDNAAPKKRAIQ